MILLCCLTNVVYTYRYGDGAGNTVEENSSLLRNPNALVAFSALTPLVVIRKSIWPVEIE